MQNIISYLCNGNPPLDEERHFPEDDFIDSLTGAQYFLHRHLSAEVGESTHIHIFKRWSSENLHSQGLESVTTHLAALALDSTGQPDYWFVVNQWVVGDYWLPAEDTIKLFRGWTFSKTECQKKPNYGYWHEWIANEVQNGRFLFCPNGSHCSQYDDQKHYFPGVIQFLKDVNNGTFNTKK